MFMFRQKLGKAARLKSAAGALRARYAADGVASTHDMASVLPENPSDTAFRLYACEWWARFANDRVSDTSAIFVALGTATGEHVHRVLESTKTTRPYWLLDAWDGRTSAADATTHYPESTDFDAVKHSFAPWPNVNFLRGVIPSTLSAMPDTPIAFTYICLGDAVSEIASFRYLLPRLARNGVILFPGFGRKRTDPHRREWIDAASHIDVKPFVMPTGHAIFVR